MKYLVDTHIFLWWLNNDKRLRTSIKSILSDPDNIIYVSVITAWEMSIKLKAKGKLKLKTPIENCFKSAGFETLDIKLSHVLALEKLPYYHKDPFDRMLLSQALEEQLTLVSADEKLWKYQVPVLRCGIDI